MSLWILHRVFAQAQKEAKGGLTKRIQRASAVLDSRLRDPLPAIRREHVSPVIVVAEVFDNGLEGDFFCPVFIRRL